MTQHEIEMTIARVLGEVVTEIQQRRCQAAKPIGKKPDCLPNCRPPRTIDWDEYDLRRNVAIVQQPVCQTRRPRSLAMSVT